jgi:glycerol-3-phosphate dehydrogenase
VTGLRRPDAAALAGRFDVAVVGAGINGAAIARDAALRGLSVLVVDQADAGSGTSAWSSRLIHGGLRYLEHGELSLVHESLHDRERLLQIAPHLVTPLPFVVPLYPHNHKPGWMFRAGMVAYDALSLRKSVPRHRALGRKAVAVELPSLRRAGLSGALRYYDGQVVHAERLVLETLLSAADAGARVLTHSPVTAITTEGGRATGLTVHDGLTGATHAVRARVVVNAAGPWVDAVARGVPLAHPRFVGGTKGSHLVVDPFPGAPDVALYYEARSDNRPILVIPWNGRYLIGTTDDRFDGDLDTTAATADEIDYLLAETNSLLPRARLRRADILFTYAGVRPLPHSPDGATGSISRSHSLLTDEAVGDLVTVVGGKLTPHLSLAAETVEIVGRLLGRTLPPSTAARRPLPGAPASGRGADWPDEAAWLRTALADDPEGPCWPVALVERLLAVYGGRARDLADLVRENPVLARVVGDGRGAVAAAEVTLAVREEGALHLADVLHRRTMVGLEPALGLDVDDAVAEIAAPLLGWSADDVDREVAAHRSYVEQRLRGGLDPIPVQRGA